jgi:ABC-2 type transport system ATP-binding protein/lipopolysaccharide transport system ATP-binding protein
MKSRLAFSIASSVNPEILILDEVLSVGDISFQKKCKERMSNMMQDDVTLLFVSHSIAQVRDLCDKAVWLNQGQLMSKGEVNTVCNEFIDYVQKNKLL